MTYIVKISDEKGSPITPKFLIGSLAEHFAACILTSVDLLNKGVMQNEKKL